MSMNPDNTITMNWSDFIFESPKKNLSKSFVIGILEGEGIGAEIIAASLHILRALESVTNYSFEIRNSGLIGLNENRRYQDPISTDLIQFCQDIFSDGGAILAGAGGGRFVYDLRRQFDLFCKLIPVKNSKELAINRMKPEYLTDIDILLIRENISGLYFGKSNIISTSNDIQVEYQFSYSEKEVHRILLVAAKIALNHRKHLTVVIKDGGLPAISKLWWDCTLNIVSELGIDYSLINIDHAAYHLIQHAQELDVVVAPNLFGDVLADVSGILLGSRTFSFSGNFSSQGAAVYQTNHGAAYDLMGKDQANPVGQILSLAMMLRQSFGLNQEATLMERAIAQTWRQGWRTADIQENSCHLIGTKEMGERIADTLVKSTNKLLEV
ncbi:isocitrate/isopropylmalate family dehydrogenase [Cronbergia sp. UHCC 0137]|uniref:isocitrate/isopropylmalate family dehydrogenase n=1 Tax=Cronbergia sp. UHCC 0137 TaxID=3110239 RepID=UPI002B1F9C78|nr:isocitrate/isopropylmalate family dehydrogenase [Cronbergia sp. UHCC 0137]MEA5617991.1 isocitrate/isopropylmalate family dehydrogenase [Cronbergia sp. UHCC 0137]